MFLKYLFSFLAAKKQKIVSYMPQNSEIVCTEVILGDSSDSI